MNPFCLQNILDEVLKAKQIEDYCPNGLQVEGCLDIQRIVTGVTASQSLIERAIECKADALLVHHGYFWKGEQPVLTGTKGKRIATLFTNHISLFAYHIPLDIHPELGNNVQLAKQLGIKIERSLEPWNERGIAIIGELDHPLSGKDFLKRVKKQLRREPLYLRGHSRLIHKVGICTGSGQDYLQSAAEQGLDAFISGEVSERTTHISREMEIDYFAAGHHATERYGIQALGNWLSQQHSLNTQFVDIDNPV